MIATVQDFLQPGERILWSGQPRASMYALQGGWFLVLFSLMWLGFAVFWEITAISMGAPIFFWLFGAIFVAIGLYFAFGRLWMAFREARRTVYAVTDERVLVVAGANSQSLSEMSLGGLVSLSMERGRDGRGVIHFTEPGPWRFWMASWLGSGPRPLAFYGVDDVERVFRIIQAARAEVRNRRS